MTNEVVKTKEYFLNLVSAVIKQETVPDVPEGVNLSLLCKIGAVNTVQSILYQAFSSKRDLLSQEDFLKLEKAYKLSVIRQLTQQEELRILRSIFEEKGIDFMLLKGTHLKELYPSAELRFMVDMDILVNEKDLNAGKEILLSRGFQLDFDNGKDIVFIKKPFLTVELHRSLFPDDYFMYDYFKGSLERAERLSGRELKMNNEDLYVYTLAHLAEHYTSAGSCFRPMMDLYLMEEKFAFLDFSYINKQFAEIGISEFAGNIRRLAKCMFENEPKDETLEMMENYIVLGPPVKNAAEASAMANTGKTKSQRLFETAFPSLSHMKLKYPVLKKLPFLLPVFWIVRITSFIFSKDKKIAEKREEVVSIDKSSVDIMSEIFEKSGLNIKK